METFYSIHKAKKVVKRTESFNQQTVQAL